MSLIQIHIENSSTKTKEVSISDVLANVQADKDICYAFRHGGQKVLDKMLWQRIRLQSTCSFWDRRKERIVFRNRKTGQRILFSFETFWMKGQYQHDILDITLSELENISNSLDEYEILCPIPAKDEMSVFFDDTPTVKGEIVLNETSEEKYEGNELEIKFKENNIQHPFTVLLRKSGDIVWEFPAYNETGITFYTSKLQCNWEDWPGPPEYTKKLEINLVTRDGNKIIFTHRSLGSYDRQFFEMLWNSIALVLVKDAKPFEHYVKKQKP